MLLLAILLLWPASSTFTLSVDYSRDLRTHSSALAAPSGATGSEEGGFKDVLFKWVNFLVLFGGLGYFLRKPIKQFLATRGEEIRRSLEEARAAKEKSERELAEALAKLEHIEQEVASLKSAAAAEMEADRRQILESAGREAEKIIASAREEVALLVKNAEKDLREHSAALVVQMAERQIRSQIRPEDQGRMFQHFVASLDEKARSKQSNS